MIRYTGILFVFVAVVFLSVCSCLSAGSSEAPLQAMILTGQCNHNWRVSTPILMRILEQSGLFEVYPVIAPSEGSDSEMERFRPDFARYDVVVLHYVGDKWPEAVNQAFVEYVKSGGGVVAIHSACNAFPDWPQYNRILGLGGWYGRDERWGPYIRWQGGRLVRDMSPGRAGSHPDKHAFEIVTRNSEHPVMKGLPARWLHSRDGLNIEMRGPAEDLTVLATAYVDQDGDTMLLSKNSNYRRLRINGGFELPLNTFSPPTIRMERLSRTSLKISITLNDITYTTIDDEPADLPQKIDVFAITFPNARNYTRWVLAGSE